MSGPETRLVKRLLVKLRREFGEDLFIFKVHGGPFQMTGLPDLVGCLRGRFVGIEVKVGSNQPSKIQHYILTRINRAGGVGMWGNSVPGIMSELEERLNDSHD